MPILPSDIMPVLLPFAQVFSDGIVNLTDQHKRALYFRRILTSRILPCLHSDVFFVPFGGHCSHFRSSCCAIMG